MTNKFSKEKLEELVDVVNYVDRDFEDGDHSLDCYFSKEDYDKLIALGWTDDDFSCVWHENDPDDFIYASLCYYPMNKESYETVPDVIDEFFKPLGIVPDQSCNG
jgi:hypothetical protein